MEIIRSPLEHVIESIYGEFKDEIPRDSKNQVLDSNIFASLNLGDVYSYLNYKDDAALYDKIFIFIPLRRMLSDDNKQLCGELVYNHCQLDSGIIVPRHIAKRTGFHYQDYSMPKTSILTTTSIKEKHIATEE